MLRLLFWIALIATAYWLWRRFQQPSPRKETAAEPEATPTVLCAHCGAHLPKDRALSTGEQWFCSPEHQRLGKHD